MRRSRRMRRMRRRKRRINMGQMNVYGLYIYILDTLYIED